MCGIAGLYADKPVDPARLAAMTGCLGHRGPDESGSHLDGNLGLGHTRLSIIDLAGGHQPLTADDGELVLIANGEIYNYVELRAELEAQGRRFLTHSDSEVILHLYTLHGTECLARLNGMFAFALYDRRRRQLLLARDRLGIKPLFIAELPEGVAFASELKALRPVLPHGFEVDAAGLVQYLHNQFSTGPTTIVRGVERVAPGEALVIEGGRIARRWRYWSPRAAQPRKLSLEAACEEFDALMATVMREHMRADVPFGLFLSGGVDSGVLLALLTRYHSHPIRTFSVGFPATGVADELPLALRMAQRYGSVHTEIRPEREALFRHLPVTVWAADDLMRDYATLPTSLLAKRAAEELKVVFSGEGGDEVFAGYRRFRQPPLKRLINSLLRPGTGGFRSRGSLSAGMARRLLRPNARAAFAQVRQPFAEAWQAAPRSWSHLQRLQYAELVTALPDNLMVKADRMTMAWGLEGRVPFLDHRVVEFGLSLPDELKVSTRSGKLFLKHWARELLNPDHLRMPKRGFSVPTGEWLSGELLEQLARVLPRQPVIREWFEPEAVAELFARQRGGSGRWSQVLFALFQFAIWQRVFVRDGGARPDPEVDPIALLEG